MPPRDVASLEKRDDRLYADAVNELASATPPAVGSQRGAPGFARYAWLVLGYILLVILFGAWVRISGSGAGCGDHWPTCHGELVPRAPELETIIEYTHRITSGILGPMAILMVVWAYRGAGRKKPERVCAVATLALIVVEALIGAGLVLNELVADDDSVARAIAVALHLGNTLILTAASALTAWFGAGRGLPSLGLAHPVRRLLAFGLFGIMLVCMSGAVTALGDTLFPVTPSPARGWYAQLGLEPGAHFLVQLRAVHPLLAVVVAAGLYALARRIERGLEASPREGLWLARTLAWSVGAQLVAGAVNVALGAPGWMQLLHLLLAQLVWLVCVLLFVAVGEEPRSVNR